MQHAPVAQSFLQQYLPSKIHDNLDITTRCLEDSTYIDEEQRKSFSDLVFNCKYAKEQGAVNANIVLLVEHQSVPDKLMPFRVFHYMFNMLFKKLKAKDKSERDEIRKTGKLPAVYALVFYHGKQTPYPYSMSLSDCFDDPLNFMESVLSSPVPLLDIGQVPDEQIKQQPLLGLVTGALKHISDDNVDDWLLASAHPKME